DDRRRRDRLGRITPRPFARRRGPPRQHHTSRAHRRDDGHRRRRRLGEGVQVVGWPLYRLLGGAARAIPAYAGGVSLGYQEPPALVEEDSWTPTPGTRSRTGDVSC